jgi:hypothetical protein
VQFDFAELAGGCCDAHWPRLSIISFHFLTASGLLGSHASDKPPRQMCPTTCV